MVSSTLSSGPTESVSSTSEPSISGILKPSDSAIPVSDEVRTTPINHNINFQTVLPGYPYGYFAGILPPVPQGQVYPGIGYPSYDYTSVLDHTLSTPYKNSLYQPTSPEPMYTFAMPWCAFPYGIPVPTTKPKTVEPEVPTVVEESEEKEAVDVKESSFSRPRPQNESVPDPEQQPEVPQVREVGVPLGYWGGK